MGRSAIGVRVGWDFSIVVVLWIAGAAVAGVLGYRLGVRSPRAESESSISSRNPLVSWEYYSSSASFSEVATAKGDLRAMAWRYLSDLESRIGPLRASRSNAIARHGGEDGGGSVDAGELAAQELREGLVEFAGTPQEVMFRQHLLTVLRRWERHEEWVTTYLDLAYRNPTEPLVGRLAGQALRAATQVNRLDEVLDALQRIALIPISFEAKAEVQSALRGVAGRTEETR